MEETDTVLTSARGTRWTVGRGGTAKSPAVMELHLQECLPLHQAGLRRLKVDAAAHMKDLSAYVTPAGWEVC